MKLIVGLGNPGNKYNLTWHNLGFMTLDQLIQGPNFIESGWKKFNGQTLICESQKNFPEAKLLKPQTFMNESGTDVKKVSDFFKISPNDIWVVHDDLDLTPGKIKVDFGASAAGHRGVTSIIDHLGTQEFWRFRIGIGRPPEPLPADAFVLQAVSDNELKQTAEWITRACALIEQSLMHNIEKNLSQPST